MNDNLVTKIEVIQNVNREILHERGDSNKLESASPSSGNIRSKDILKEVQDESKYDVVFDMIEFRQANTTDTDYSFTKDSRKREL